MVYEYKRPILLSLHCGMTDTRARMLLDHPKEQRIIEWVVGSELLQLR